MNGWMDGGREGGREKETERKGEGVYEHTHIHLTHNPPPPHSRTQAVTDPTCLYYLTLQGLAVGEAACGGQSSGLLLRRLEEGKLLQQV